MPAPQQRDLAATWHFSRIIRVCVGAPSPLPSRYPRCRAFAACADSRRVLAGPLGDPGAGAHANADGDGRPGRSEGGQPLLIVLDQLGQCLANRSGSRPVRVAGSGRGLNGDNSWECHSLFSLSRYGLNMPE
jgi:hypothetical protein